MDAQPGDVAEEVKRLQRCINDLVSLFALPAMWSGGEPTQIVHTLLDALLRILQLDLVYVRLTDSGGGAPLEMVRFAQSQDQTAQSRGIGEGFKHWLGADPRERLPLMRNPIGGRDISIVPLGLGLQGKIGEIVAGSERADFPRQTERLILNVAANQASIALQGARLLSEQKQVARALEKAETELRERATGLEAKIRRLIDANLMGIFTWNLEGRIVEANEVFLTMVQRDHEEAASGNLRWTDLTPAEWRVRDELAVADLQATGTMQPYRKEYLRKDGSRVPVLVGAALVEKGGNDGVAFAFDLSEQKRAEEALLRVEQQSRAVVDSALDAVVAMDVDGRIMDWNKQAEEIFGWSRPEALGRMMVETIIPAEHRLAHEKGLRHFLKTGEGPVLNRRIEITALRRDGAEFPVELSITPLKSGDSWTFSSFIRDITDRKLAEERLRTSELNLRRMTETIPEMLWSATPDGAIDYCNSRVLDYTGLSPDEIAGAGWMKAIHPDDADGVVEAWNRSVATGEPFQFEFRGRHAPDGTYRWCISRALPLRAAAGDILKWYGNVIDFHARKQAQDDLRNAQAELAHVNRVMTMGELAASIAHEVNQPLAAIIASGDSCTAWLANQPPNLDKARAAAARIVQAATQASDVVRRIRALFKKTPSTTTPLEINEVIAETILLVGGEVQKKGALLEAELAADLPPVFGDRIQLQQVILNLVINGTEAMAAVADRPRRLAIQSALSEPGEILVSVADTGPGIDPQKTGRMFEPFFTTKPEGIGMGLSISRSIIEAHGGRLWAVANQPRGAVFHFALPTTTPRA